jgi:hypothetical protein
MFGKFGYSNIVLYFNGMLIPLLPIAFHTKAYCRKNGLKYKTEHEHVIEYIENLNLEDYVGPHHPHEVVVLGDSGYDDKNTVCLPKNSPKKERTEFRIRQITGYLRGVGKAQHTDLFGI